MPDVRCQRRNHSPHLPLTSDIWHMNTPLVGIMQTFWQDLRFGARMLLKKPSFTLIAVITLALGIGANTAVFTLIEGAFLSPFPIVEPERVVALSLKTKSGELNAFSYPYYKD